MPYQLKPGQEAFEVVDGPMAGRCFAPGKIYNQIPKSEARRFAKVTETEPEASAAKPARGKSKAAKGDKQS